MGSFDSATISLFFTKKVYPVNRMLAVFRLRCRFTLESLHTVEILLLGLRVKYVLDIEQTLTFALHS